MNKKKKILFLAPYPFGIGPSQRLKYEQYYGAFEQAGYELTTSSFIDAEFWKIVYKEGHLWGKIIRTIRSYFRRFFDLLRIRKFDIVYIHLWVTPLGPPIFETLVCLLAKKIVYDIDDMIFLDNGSHRMLDKIKGKNKSIVLMKKANHIIVCSPFLADFVRKYNNKITVILATYNTEKSLPLKIHSEHNPIVIGWTGTHSTLKYLNIIEPALKKIAQIRDIDFLVICNYPYENSNFKVKNITWTSENEFEDLRKIDIGIYPFEKDQWVLGKSGNKAFAYMNLGIPCVATDYGTNHLVIQHGENGFLVDNKEDEWYKYLLKLIDNVELRQRIGENGRKTIEDKYSVIVTTQTYLNILQAI